MLLQCWLDCSSKMNVVNATAEPMEEYLAEHYNYLQFAYHKRLCTVFLFVCLFISYARWQHKVKSYSKHKSQKDRNTMHTMNEQNRR